MKYFDKHPNRFRLLTILYSFFLCSILFVTFFRYISSPTDENLFITTPSVLSFNKKIAVESFNLKLKQADDYVRIGDLLLFIDYKYIKNASEAYEIFKQSSNKALIFRVYRPSNNRYYSFKIASSEGLSNCLNTIRQTVNIIAITENGASDRAGLKNGDLIFKINEQTFNTAIEADVILRRGYTGKPIVYHIYRNNQIITLNVVLARFGIQIRQLILFITSLIYIFIGIFISLKLPTHIAGRLIGSSILLTGYSIGISVISRDSFNDLIVNIKNMSLPIAAVLSLFFLIHSLLYFPQKRPELIKNKKYLAIPYIIIILIFLIRLITRNNQLFFYSFAAMPLFVLIFLVVHRKYRSPEYIKLIKYIKWAYVIIAINLCYFLLVNIFNRFGFLIPLQGLFFIPVPIAYLYTIGRYQLYNADFRIKRNIQYSIAISVWALSVFMLFLKTLTYLSTIQMDIPNFVLTGSSIEILKTPLSPDKYQYFENSILMIAAIILGYLFLKIGRIGKRILDRKYYRSNYDYKHVANIIAEVMATKLGALELSRCMIEELAGLMHLKLVGVLFFETDDSCKCQEIQGYDGTDWNEFCITNAKKLRQNIKENSGKLIFDISELDEDLYNSFKDFGFKKIVPSYSKDRLMGVLLIGEKLSETLFYPEDTEILTVTARQAAIAIENVLLYEELAGQERLKHELDIARKIQLSTLPQKTPSIKGLDITGSSIPAKKVGGDYFDYLNSREDEITIIVGDVSGKGISAAFYQSKLQGVFRTLNGFNLSLKDLFIKANNILYKDLELKAFVTVVGSQFYPLKKKLMLTRAGHIPLYHYDSKKNRVEVIMPKGMGLALDNKGKFQDLLEERKIRYNTGDIFLFVSDGITEARDINSNEFGEEKLKDILFQLNTGTSLEIKESIIKQVNEFSTDTEQHDDQTIVVVKAV